MIGGCLDSTTGLELISSGLTGLLVTGLDLISSAVLIGRLLTGVGYSFYYCWTTYGCLVSAGIDKAFGYLVSATVLFVEGGARAVSYY